MDEMQSENPVQPSPISSAPESTPQASIPSVSPQSVITPPTKGTGSSKFSIFISILIVITLGIYAFVGYLYLQTSQLKKKISDQKITTQTPTTAPTESPSINPEEVQILNGSIARVSLSGETTTLVSKADYPSTGITGFAKVSVSPDAQKMCFESWSPAPEPALYTASIDGSNLREVSPNRKNCHWIQDSRKLVYINTSSDSTAVNIFLYDIGQNEEKNLTEGTTDEGFIRFYDIVELTPDGSKIVCQYSQTTVAAEGTTTEGNCEINLTTLKLTEI